MPWHNRMVMISDEHTATCPVLSRADLRATMALPDHPLEDRVSDILNLGASSGSTGQPKLIVVPLRGVVNADPTRQHMAGTGTMVTLVTSPLYHVNGFSFVTPELLAGTRVFVMEKFDAALAVELIEKHHITYHRHGADDVAAHCSASGPARRSNSRASTA